jgi:hypothetical protein
MKLREVRQAASDVAAIPQRINLMVALSFMALMVATAALVIIAVKEK